MSQDCGASHPARESMEWLRDKLLWRDIQQDGLPLVCNMYSYCHTAFGRLNEILADMLGLYSARPVYATEVRLL